MDFAKVVSEVPQIARGRVWCRSCGRTMKTDSGWCMDFGWPKCCGYTMTIDSLRPRTRRVRDSDHSNRPKRRAMMAQLPIPEYDAAVKIQLALIPLTPAERVTALAWAIEGYCPKCGYPSPPDGEDCGCCAQPHP